MAKELAASTSADFPLQQAGKQARSDFPIRGKVWRFVGSGIVAGAFMLIALTFAAVVFPFIRVVAPNKEAAGRRIRGIISNSFGRFLKSCSALGLIRPIKVRGLEQFEPGRPCIIVANHPTLFDVVVLGSLINDFNCVVKQKLAKNIFLGGCVEAAAYVTNGKPQEIIEDCMAGFKRGQPLIIFPEGTRSPERGLGPFNRGAAHLALRSGVPLITAVLRCDPPGFTKRKKWYAIPSRAMEYSVDFELFEPAAKTQAIKNHSVCAREMTRELERFFNEKFAVKQTVNEPVSEQLFHPAILIPNHNHKEEIRALLDRLAPFGIDCLIVDDGSEPMTQRVLEDQAARRSWVKVLRRPQQGGKGAAVIDGLRHLRAAGYTHAVQMDADGQHHSADLPKFLHEAQTNPDALILGTPTYGPDVPRVRLIGRQISRVLVWFETFSFAISDPLLGYRVYPLSETVPLIERRTMGQRMDFDPEIAVRLKWSGVPVRNVRTRVCYPENGHSNFRMVADNISMVALHFRLFGGMLRRLVGTPSNNG
jgi:1-acyl-sn-glycerol-3-phosphate acyltransferase